MEKSVLQTRIRQMRDSGVLPSVIMKKLHITYATYKNLYTASKKTTLIRYFDESFYNKDKK